MLLQYFMYIAWAFLAVASLWCKFSPGSAASSCSFFSVSFLCFLLGLPLSALDSFGLVLRFKDTSFLCGFFSAFFSSSDFFSLVLLVLLVLLLLLSSESLSSRFNFAASKWFFIRMNRADFFGVVLLFALAFTFGALVFSRSFSFADFVVLGSAWLPSSCFSDPWVKSTVVALDGGDLRDEDVSLIGVSSMSTVLARFKANLSTVPKDSVDSAAFKVFCESPLNSLRRTRHGVATGASGPGIAWIWNVAGGPRVLTWGMDN